MLSFLEFTFTSIWHFAGISILLTTCLNFVFKFWNSFWRHQNIRKHGYPPAHCDADGDRLKTEND